MPYAISEIRAFERLGHTVHVADTFEQAPGNNSARATSAHVTVSPRLDPAGYKASIDALVDRFAIDLVIPTFEEAFYLARFGQTAGERKAPIFVADFETLGLLHNKNAFLSFATDLGLEVPQTFTCTSKRQLVEAIGRFDHFFARAAFSRAGVALFTNTGPLAGDMTLDEIEPSVARPWVVQEFIDGVDHCSFSVVRHGKVVAHSTYQHPKMLDDAGGIVFESVVEPLALHAAQTIAAATNYHGQLSLDFLKTSDGRLHIVECNPRATSGVSVMPDTMFVGAVLGEFDGQEPQVARAGKRASIRSALLRDMVVNPAEAWNDLKEIFSDTDDVYFDPSDMRPGLFQFFSLAHVFKRWMSDEVTTGEKLAAGYLHDICWDGDAMDQPSANGPAVAV